VSKKKFELEADFTEQDLQTMLDALDDWEMQDMGFLELIDKIKHIPNPPEDSSPDYVEAFTEFKKHMLSQEDKVRKNRNIRREKATLLKAKIILMNQARAAEKFLDEC
jgi:hypothetical protein